MNRPRLPGGSIWPLAWGACQLSVHLTYPVAYLGQLHECDGLWSPPRHFSRLCITCMLRHGSLVCSPMSTRHSKSAAAASTCTLSDGHFGEYPFLMPRAQAPAVLFEPPDDASSPFASEMHGRVVFAASPVSSDGRSWTVQSACLKADPATLDTESHVVSVF